MIQVRNQLNWKVGGPAGKGIMTTGLIFSKTCAAHGWEIFDYPEYPSLITGGHNTYQVFSSVDKALAQRHLVDLLVALDKPSLELHPDELHENSLVVFDGQSLKAEYPGPGQAVNIPLKQLAVDAAQDPLMANNVALGASAALLGLDIELLKVTIARIFEKKGEAVVTHNQAAAQAGWDYVAQHYAQLQSSPIEKKDDQFMTMTGNEAISWGAIAGGLQFFAAYPMTPSSSILHTLVAKEKVADIVVKHAEDEIGAVNMVLGGSFTGARTMIATSGGGFCYMTEAIGLSGVAELPLVMVNSMRPGPALGMPTWTAQGDLQMVINSSQDDFPLIVLAPGDATQAFEMTKLSFELAEKYQLPVIILSDKYLSESRLVVRVKNEVFANERFGFDGQPQADENGFYPRYKLSENGISQRSIPGQVGGTHVANSYEHDEYGIGTESGEVRTQQMEKRFKKVEVLKKEVFPQLYSQTEAAQLTLVGFGSTQGPMLEAQKMLAKEGVSVNVFNLSWMWPFPVEQVLSVINEGLPLVVVEGNYQGQLAALIAQETGHKATHSLRRYDGRPFYAEEIVKYVKSLKL